jgi:hypothetical protein
VSVESKLVDGSEGGGRRDGVDEEGEKTFGSFSGSGGMIMVQRDNGRVGRQIII